MKIFIIAVAIGISAAAQTSVDLKSQSRPSTKPLRSGTTLPPACTSGDMFFKSDAPGGANLYGCVNGSWLLQGGGSGDMLKSMYDPASSASQVETVAHKDQNGGYVGRDINGVASIPGGVSAGSGPTRIGIAKGTAPADTTVLAQSMDAVLYQDAADNHIKVRKSDATVKDLEGATRRAFGYSFSGAGAPLTAGTTGYLTVPFACTISAWNLAVNTGTATVDIWKVAAGTAIPPAANTITASATPAITTGTAVHSATLTGWTTAVAANDIVGINLRAVATATFVNLTVECAQ